MKKNFCHCGAQLAPMTDYQVCANCGWDQTGPGSRADELFHLAIETKGLQGRRYIGNLVMLLKARGATPELISEWKQEIYKRWRAQ